MTRAIQAYKNGEEREDGFTLIELLVVVIIIGILAAIAIPAFLNQRERSYVATAESDARNAAIEIESQFAENDAYPADGTDLTTIDVQPSANVTLDYTLDSAQSYTIIACHALVDGADCTTDPPTATATYDSDAGGIQ